MKMPIKRKLSQEQKKELKKRLKKRIAKLREKTRPQAQGKIEQQIERDRSEVKDANIIVCAFNDGECKYDFIRTEPLYFFREKNFDVLIHGNKTTVLVEIKDNLSSSHKKKLDDFFESKEKVVEDIEFKNDISGKKENISEYLENIIGDKIKQNEFVLSSQRVNHRKIKNSGENLCLWNLLKKANKIYITYEKVHSDEDETFLGHHDASLIKYLNRLDKKGKDYTDLLTFMYSSSNFLKAESMSITLLNKTNNEFDFSDWLSIFKIDVMNWHEEEKRKVYKDYIEYGLDCGFIRIEEDRGDLFQNKYSVVSMYRKTSKLQDDLIEKMIDFETEKLVKEKKPKFKSEIKQKILQEEAEKTGQKSIEDFD